MTSTQGRSLRWYLITGLLFVTPPVLGLCGVRFPTQPPDEWVTSQTAAGNEDPQSGQPEESLEINTGNQLPSVAVLLSEQLLRREVFESTRQAIEEIRRALPDCEINWVGDAPSRTGLLRRPRSVIPGEDAEDRHWERAFSELKEHPLVVGHQLSADETTMLILFSDSSAAATDTIRKVLRKHLDPLGVRLRMTGEVLMLREHQEAMLAWHSWVLGLATIVVTLTGFLMLKAVRRSLAVAAGPITALAMALGWQHFLGLPFNEFAALDMPVFVLVLAFADSLHILLAVEEEYGHSGDARDAVHRAMKRMLRPCFLTSVTTSLAFVSLMISSQPVISGFGRNSAVGVCIAFFGVVTVMPMAAAACVRGRPPETRQTSRRKDRWIQRPILLGVKYPVVTTVATLLITVGCVYYSGTTLYPDDRLDLRLNRDEPSYQGLLQCDRKLGGLRQVTVTVTWPEDASGEQIWDVLSSIQQQVSDSESFSEPLSILNSLQLLPGKHTAQKLRHAERLADGRMADFWDEETREAVIEFRVPDRGVQFIEDDLQALRSLLENEQSLHPGFHTVVGGESLLLSSIVRTTIGEMAWSVLLAAGIILLVIWIAYDRLQYALFSILPNLFALALTFAVRAWMAPSLDIASACAASICLGLGVDDTIHFLEAMRHAKGRPGSRIRILNAGHLVGRAIVVTTFALLCGFATVFIAPLPPHQFFASMVVATLPAALFGALVILPASLSLLRDRPARRIDQQVASELQIREREPAAEVEQQPFGL